MNSTRVCEGMRDKGGSVRVLLLLECVRLLAVSVQNDVHFRYYGKPIRLLTTIEATYIFTLAVRTTEHDGISNVPRDSQKARSCVDRGEVDLPCLQA